MLGDPYCEDVSIERLRELTTFEPCKPVLLRPVALSHKHTSVEDNPDEKEAVIWERERLI